MAEDKKSFILYADLITVVEKLIIKDRENKTNYAGELFLHILLYVNDKEPIPIDFIIEMTFEPIKLQLKRDLIHWKSVRNSRSESGKLGGRPKKANKPNAFLEKQTKTNKAVNDTVTVNVNDTVIKKKIPTYEDFKSYALENQENTDLHALDLKYKAWVENGWKDGNNKSIKNWKSKLLNTLKYIQSNEKNRTINTSQERAKKSFISRVAQSEQEQRGGTK